jgi:hypothetical protein
MEKVFQKVLPTFTDNVNKLARIAGNIPESSTSSVLSRKK